MGRIDDPLDQLVRQSRPESNHARTAAALAAVALGPFAPLCAAIVGGVSVVGDMLSDSERDGVQAAMHQAIADTLAKHDVQLERLERQADSAAREAIRVAVRVAYETGRSEKAYRATRVVMEAALAPHRINWDEVVTFVEDLSRLTNDDIEALTTLWRFQRQGRSSTPAELPMMSTDLNRFTETWPKLIEHVLGRGGTKDDWDARCARLFGFGLAASVRANSSHQGTDDNCYRLTGRGARLLQLLGWDMNPGSYPRIRRHPERGEKTVQDEVEDRALGPGWA